jgi:hypothetical protein
MIQEEGTRICTYMWSEVRSVRNRDKGPMAGRKYVLGSGNGARSVETTGDRVWSSGGMGRSGKNTMKMGNQVMDLTKIYISRE